MREDDLPSPEDGGHWGLAEWVTGNEKGSDLEARPALPPSSRTFALCGKLAASAKAACSRVCRMGQVGAEIGLDFGAVVLWV